MHFKWWRKAEAWPLLLPCRRCVPLEGFELETKILRAMIDDDLIGGFVVMVPPSSSMMARGLNLRPLACGAVLCERIDREGSVVSEGCGGGLRRSC